VNLKVQILLYISFELPIVNYCEGKSTCLNCFN